MQINAQESYQPLTTSLWHFAVVLLVGEEPSYPETEIPSQYLWCSGGSLDELLGKQVLLSSLWSTPSHLGRGPPCHSGDASVTQASPGNSLISSGGLQGVPAFRMCLKDHPEVPNPQALERLQGCVSHQWPSSIFNQEDHKKDGLGSLLLKKELWLLLL